MTQIAILLAALLLAAAVGFVLKARAGKVRASSTRAESEGGSRSAMLTAVGLDHDGPTVLHFSADWCGPCAAVRRVVGQAIADLSSTAKPPTEVELDIDEHSALAKELGVLSLPTTFIFDSSADQRFRISGVPTLADLRTALIPLTS